MLKRAKNRRIILAQSFEQGFKVKIKSLPNQNHVSQRGGMRNINGRSAVGKGGAKDRPASCPENSPKRILPVTRSYQVAKSCRVPDPAGYLILPVKPKSCFLRCTVPKLKSLAYRTLPTSWRHRIFYERDENAYSSSVMQVACSSNPCHKPYYSRWTLRRSSPHPWTPFSIFTVVIYDRESSYVISAGLRKVLYFWS